MYRPCSRRQHSAKSDPKHSAKSDAKHFQGLAPTRKIARAVNSQPDMYTNSTSSQPHLGPQRDSKCAVMHTTQLHLRCQHVLDSFVLSRELAQVRVPERRRTVEALLWIEVEQALQEREGLALQAARVPRGERLRLRDGERDVLVCRVHLKEQPVLDDDWAQHLLDAVQLVDV